MFLLSACMVKLRWVVKGGGGRGGELLVNIVHKQTHVHHISWKVVLSKLFLKVHSAKWICAQTWTPKLLNNKNSFKKFKDCTKNCYVLLILYPKCFYVNAKLCACTATQSTAIGWWVVGSKAIASTTNQAL
jgi:hypothetical protein